MKWLAAFIIILLCALATPAVDIPVHSGGNIQTAINSANLGDTITIDIATFSISTPLILKTKPGCTGSSFIDIRSVELGSISVPVNALRDPMSAGTLAHMPMIQTISTIGEGVFTAEASAGCYRLQGLRLGDNTAASSVTYIDLNGGGAHFIIDRIAIIPRDYPYSGPNYNTSARIGVIANATDVTVKNSDILGMYGLLRGDTLPTNSQIDSECILTDVGPCNPCLFDNNYLEGGFDPIFLGGADPPATATATIASGATLTGATLTSVVGSFPTVGMTIALQAVNGYPAECNHPATAQSLCYGNGIIQSANSGTGAITYTALVAQSHDNGAPRVNLTTNPVTGGVAQWDGQRIKNVTVTHNHTHLRTDFYAVYTAIPGKSGPKSYIEIKFVDGMLYEGNYHDGWFSNWGFASYNQNGGGVWTQEKDIVCKNNWFNGFNMALSIPMADPYYLNTTGQNVSVTNNLWTNPDNSGVTGSDPTSFFVSGHYGGNVTIEHNTVLIGYPNVYTGKSWNWDQCDGSYYGKTGPMTIRNNIWGMGNYGFTGDPSPGTPAYCWPTRTISNNLAYNNAANPDAPSTFNSQFPSGTALSGDGSTVLFTGSNFNSLGDWVLTTSSPGYHAATDGSDIGINCSAIETALGASGLCNSSTGERGRMLGKVRVTGTARLLTIAFIVFSVTAFGMTGRRFVRQLKLDQKIRAMKLSRHEAKLLNPEPARPAYTAEAWRTREKQRR